MLLCVTHVCVCVVYPHVILSMHFSVQDCLTKQVARAEHAEARTAEQNKLLLKAKAQLRAFRSEYPNFRPPEDVLLVPNDDQDARDIFWQVDKDLDLKMQLKHDPSGMLTTFWEDQRKQLRSSTPRTRRWNPQVVSGLRLGILQVCKVKKFCVPVPPVSV